VNACRRRLTRPPGAALLLRPDRTANKSSRQLPGCRALVKTAKTAGSPPVNAAARKSAGWTRSPACSAPEANTARARGSVRSSGEKRPWAKSTGAISRRVAVRADGPPVGMGLSLRICKVPASPLAMQAPNGRRNGPVLVSEFFGAIASAESKSSSRWEAHARPEGIQMSPGHGTANADFPASERGAASSARRTGSRRRPSSWSQSASSV
jgi:hypothetical protein